MFFSVREEKYDNGILLHNIWREDYKIVENLDWTNCLTFLLDTMLEYDTMQVKTLAGIWYETVWSKKDIQSYIDSAKNIEYSFTISW